MHFLSILDCLLFLVHNCVHTWVAGNHRMEVGKRWA